MNVYYIVSFLTAFIVVLALIPVIRKWAFKVGFLDIPAGVKDHNNPIPLGGGIAVFAGSIIMVNILFVLFDLQYAQSAIGLIAGSVLVLIIGIYDDFYEMSAFGKILGQVICVLILLSFIKNHPPILSLPAYYLLSAAWIIGLMNAINYIDNLDGLCGGVSLLIALGFGALFILRGMPFFAIISLTLAGAALGFLRYNLSPASIFLGDGGSLLFGFALSSLGIVYFNTSTSISAALSPILLMAFPIFDMTLVTIARLNKGRKVYIASKDHAWDMIRILGYSKKTTVHVILMINFMLVASGLAIFFMDDSPIQIFLVFAFGLLLAFVGTQLYRNFLYLKESVESLFVDIIAINSSFVLYFFIRYSSGIFGTYQPFSLDMLAVPLAWINGFWIILYTALGLYDISFEARFRHQMKTLLKSLLVGGAIFLFANYKPQTGFQISVGFILMFLLILLTVEIILRWFLYRYFYAYLNRSASKLNALIIKPEEFRMSDDDLGQIRKRYNLLGLVGKGSLGDLENLGPVSQLFEIIKKTRTARLVLDIQTNDLPDLTDIFSSAYFMETIFLVSEKNRKNIRGLKFRETNVKNVLSVSIKHRPLFQMIFRRVADTIFAFLFLCLASPVILFKAASLKLKRLPIFNNVECIVRGEKMILIRCWADCKDGDIQIIPIVFSVFKGHLNFYGTTLTTINEYKNNFNVIPGYWRKFLVKPGLFGPGYSGKTAVERFNLDLAYMEKTSTFGDFWMILKQLLGMSAVKLEDLKNA